MLKFITFALTAALLATNASAAEPETAAVPCDTGCTVTRLTDTPQVVYAGAEDRTVLICAGDSWVVHIGIDSKTLDLNPQVSDHRMCVNAKGKTITVSGTAGTALIGAAAP